MRNALAFSLVVLIAGLVEGQSPMDALSFRVKARVVDLAGKPIVGAGFLCEDRDAITTAKALAEPDARTDEKGVLSLTLPPAKWGQKRHALLVAPGKTSVKVSFAVGIGGGGGRRHRLVDLGTIILRRGVDIRGLVRSSKGKPIVGARVTATDVFRSSHLRISFTESCSSFATTDEKGRFTLVGVPPRGVSVSIRADGYFDFLAQYRNQFTPLVATMDPSGVAAGTLVDAAANPVAQGPVSAYFEQSESIVTVRSNDKGRFEVPLRYRGRYRLVTGASRYPLNRQWSDTMSGPKQDIRIEVKDAAVADGEGVVVRAKSSNGKPVEDFKAVIVWINPQIWKYNKTYLKQMFAESARASDADGKLVHAGPRAGQPPTGRLLLQAQGFAPNIVDEVEWDDEKPLKLDLQLEAESVIAGVVLDENGKPIAGARVFADDVKQTPGRGNLLAQLAPGIGGVRQGGVCTDKAGRFRIRSLGKRTYHVTAVKEGRPTSRSKTVKLGTGEIRRGIELTSPRGATLTGKIVSENLGAGWLVRQMPRTTSNTMQIMLPTSVPVEAGEPPTIGAVVIGADGKFVIRGLPNGMHNLSLLIPYPLGTLEIPLKRVRIRGEDLVQEFKIDAAAPGEVSGVVKIKGAAMAPGRILVLAMRADKSVQQQFVFMTPALSGVRALVGRNGKFRMLVREGKYVIKLVDLATGVTLYQGEKQIKVQAGEKKIVDISAQLAMLVVELVPAKEDGRMVATHVEVQVKHPQIVRNQIGRVMVLPNNVIYDSGVGVALQPGQRDLTVFVPALETRLLVRSAAHQLDPKKSKFTLSPLGQETIAPEINRPHRVKIVVSEPDI